MTELPGPKFYDDESVFALYMASRKRVDNPNDTLERPIMQDLIGDPNGQRYLDLGCGDAAMGRMLLEKGARSYVGVEGSQNMTRAARETLAGTAGRVVQAELESWRFPEAAFDVLVSSLVVHYVADLDSILTKVHAALANQGRFIFSVEHPVITSSDQGWTTVQRQAWVVDDYFDIGVRVTSWLGGRAIKYHRTFEDYFGAMQRSGFTVESLRESQPEQARFADEREYQRRKRIPLFLFLAGRKQSG